MQNLGNLRGQIASKTIACAIAFTMVPAAGCGDDKSPIDRARQAQTETLQQSASERGRVMPARGEVRIEYVDGLVTVSSNHAPLAPILSQLASEADFSLTLGEEPLKNVSLSIERLALTEALPDILDGVVYGAKFRTDDLTGQRRVSHLWIGDEPPPGLTAGEPTQTDRLANRANRVNPGTRSPEDQRSREDRMRARAERVARQEEEQRRAIEQLASRDPLVRAEAASEVEPEGPGLGALLDLVYEDPDPSVRIAAVSQLEDSDTHAAVEGLIAALNDDDRRVVLEAIDALEFAGDETVIPRLEPFLDSSDDEIREAAAEAIEFLE